MSLFPPVDLAAIGFFVLAWAGYAIAVEYVPQAKDGLNARMNRFRKVWVRRLLAREVRIIDTQIMASLQNGTAFFASTSLLAIGGALTLLRSSDEVLLVMSELPFAFATSRAQWDAKTIGVVIIFVYAFFKFAWAYRLFNYVAILFGAMPPAADKDTPEAEAHVRRTTLLFETAGRHFNLGQRAIFFALGYLGWFAGPYVLMVSTLAVLIVMIRRQYFSASLRALIDDPR